MVSMSPAEISFPSPLSSLSLCFNVPLTQLLMSKHSNLILISPAPLSRPLTVCRQHSLTLKLKPILQIYCLRQSHSRLPVHLCFCISILKDRSGIEKHEVPLTHPNSMNNGWTTFVPHIYFEIYNHPGQQRCLKYENIAVRIFRLRQCNATCLEMDDVQAEIFIFF